MKQMPRWFAALCVTVLLLCSILVPALLFHQAGTRAMIVEVQGNLEIRRGQLRKQQSEYAQYLEALPQVQSELAEVQPQADAAYAKEQELRALRKALRTENADLADELATLQNAADDVNEVALQSAEACRLLDDALLQLQTLIQRLQ